MNKISTFTLFAVMCLFSVGCELQTSSGSDNEMAKRTEESMQQANDIVGMPAITNFQERKLAKLIFEMRDRQDLVTYAYIANLDGRLVYIGKCMGYGLPYSIQFTTPEKIVTLIDKGQYSTHTVSQADPNGLFMPEGLSATWLIMLDEVTGEAHPVYVESEITVSPFRIPTAIYPSQ